ncbi:unnamed protein product, partial [Effrenium voratum]
GARGHDAGPGSVCELHLKHLLALNLRKLRGQELRVAPRSYVLQGPFLDQEFARFCADFRLSHALALVRSCARAAHDEFEPSHNELDAAERPEGSWGRELPELLWEPRLEEAPLELPCLLAARRSLAQRQ